MAELVAKLITEDVTQTQGQVVGLVADKAKTTTYLLWTRTTDATPTELSLDSLGQDFIETQDNHTYMINFQVLATVEGTGDGAAWGTGMMVTRGAGFASTLPYAPLLAQAPSQATVGFPPAAVLDFDADTATDGRILLRATGVPATNIKWVARVEVTEIGE